MMKSCRYSTVINSHHVNSTDPEYIHSGSQQYDKTGASTPGSGLYYHSSIEKVHLEGRKDTKMSQLAEYCSRCNGEEKLQKHQNGQLSEQIIEALLQRYARLADIQC
jgi:hypothetical protein